MRADVSMITREALARRRAGRRDLRYGTVHEAGVGVPADGQQPVSQPSFMQMTHPLEALANRDCHRHRLRFTGQRSEFLDQLCVSAFLMLRLMIYLSTQNLVPG